MESDLLEQLQSAGWDPFHPMEECRLATDLPAMPSWLRAIDRLGIYHHYLTLRLFSRFARGTKDGDPIRRKLEAIAVVFALRQSNLKDQVTPELAEEWAKRINEWRERILKPADKRIAQTDPHVVLQNPRDFEPAFTYAYINVNMGIVDVAQDAEMLSLGLAMHDQDADKPRGVGEPATREELAAYHQFLTEQGNTIARISDTGMIEIDPLLVKHWMEVRAGPGLKIRATGTSRFELNEDDEMEDIVAALDSAEQVDRIWQVRDARLQDADEGSPRWHVLQNFFELARKELSCRDLSVRVGIPRTTIQDTYERERAAIARALHAA